MKMSKTKSKELIVEQVGSNSNPAIPDMVVNSNIFHFWNGDTYSGEFSFEKDKRSIVMDGKGIYRTFDNEIYEGIWKNDELRDECKIIFSDESEFLGALNEMKVDGLGKYKFLESVEVEGEFSGNHLSGKVNLTDPKEHLWRGEVKDNSVSFSPLHPFWQGVLLSPSTFQLFYGEAEEVNEFEY